ncbi:hypothetical protein, partial [Clostridium perfringens]
TTSGWKASRSCSTRASTRPCPPSCRPSSATPRGVIDGAEFNNPSSDRLLGFPDVAKTYMILSYHQRVVSIEILFNKG